MSTQFGQKYLIVTADDFGYSRERDAGILHCFRQQHISNVSVMMNGESVEEAVKLAMSAGLSMGLHLNLTEGTPVSPKPYQTLVSSSGFMLGKHGFRAAVQKEKVDMAEVRHEIQSQIDRYTSLVGHKPVNIDGHQHAHCIPEITKVFASVLQENGIHMTRVPVETIYSDTREFLKGVVKQAEQAERIYYQHGIWAPRFAGLKTMGQDMTVDRLKTDITEAISSPQSVMSDTIVCELMVHPGYRTGSVGGCGDGPDDFSQSHDREHEMSILASTELQSFYTDMGLKLVSFKDLPEIVNVNVKI